MKGMILAAGLGTRLRPYTNQFAKPAIPFLNIPLLYYAVYLLEAGGVTDLVVNCHHKPQQIEALTKNIPGFDGSVNLSPELEAPLGSGGGIWNARRRLRGSGSFFVANGDEVLFPTSLGVLSGLKRRHDSSDALATILVMRHPKVGSQFGGVWADESGRVAGFGKQAPESHSGLLTGYHYVGVQLLSERVFEYLPEGESNILYDALTAGIAAGEEVCIFEDDCWWHETGNPHDYLEATMRYLLEGLGQPDHQQHQSFFDRFWQKTEPRISLWQGAKGKIQTSFASETRVLLGENVSIGEGTKAEGFLVAGNNVRIGRKCHLENVVFLDRAEVPDGTTLRNHIVMPRAYQI